MQFSRRNSRPGRTGMKYRRRLTVSILLVSLGPISMTNPQPSNSQSTPSAAAHISKSVFGSTPEGVPIDSYTLHNANGASAKLITFGAALTELHMPDRNGKSGDVVLGFDTLPPYLAKHPFFGVTVGRYANRIAKGHFTLDGKAY